MIHELKTWPEYFHAVKHGFKNFEVRKNDRKFNNGDYVRLREWNPETKEYTGESITRRIGYILQGGEFGIERGFVVMQLIHDPFGPIPSPTGNPYPNPLNNENLHCQHRQTMV